MKFCFWPRLCENVSQFGWSAGDCVFFPAEAEEWLESPLQIVQGLAEALSANAFSWPFPLYARMAAASARTPSIVITRFILYPNTPGAKFDMDYYLNKHVKLVREKSGAA